jgi:hypothetical protein
MPYDGTDIPSVTDSENFLGRASKKANGAAIIAGSYVFELNNKAREGRNRQYSAVFRRMDYPGMAEYVCEYGIPPLSADHPPLRHARNSRRERHPH